jgi:hypothetical protein
MVRLAIPQDAVRRVTMKATLEDISHMEPQNIELPSRGQPLLVAWPTARQAGGFLEFAHAEQWRTFIEDLGIHPAIPEIIATKFARAQKLYLLGWIDFSLVKVGELAALIALELALTDRYGGQFPRGKPSLAKLLKHMVTADGLTDADIPMVSRCGGTVIGQLTGDVRPTLAERRNSAAHGDPFEGLPAAGLLELARDLINYSYRRYLADAETRRL